MDWDQFLAWQDYASVEPFGEDRGDFRAGIIASSVVNTLRQVNWSGKGQRPKMTKPQDFMAFTDDKRRGPKKPMGKSGWAGFSSMMKNMVARKKRKRE